MVHQPPRRRMAAGVRVGIIGDPEWTMVSCWVLNEGAQGPDASSSSGSTAFALCQRGAEYGCVSDQCAS
jgi:hypothetical protein